MSMHECSKTAFHLMSTLAHMQEPWEKQYLKHVMRETGLSLSAVAKNAGLSSTTLTRPMNDPDHSFILKRATLEKVEAAFNIPYLPFMAQGRTSKGSTQTEDGSEILPTDQAYTLQKPQSDQGLSEPAVAPWRPRDTDFGKKILNYLAPDARTPAGYRLGIAIPHLNYEAGTILVVDLNGAPKPGDTVIANKIDFDTGGAETLIGRFAPPYIVPPDAAKSPELVGRDTRIVGPIVSYFKDPE